MNIDVEVLQRIENYVSGKLTVDEAEALWMELIKNHEHFEYYMVFKDLKEFFQMKEESGHREPSL